MVDSEASCTLIDTLTYHKLTKFSPLPLSPITDIFVLADGSQLSVLSEVEFEGRIGDEYYPMTAIVAELGDNAAILGLDFMENNDVILRLSTGKLMIWNETVNLHREHAGKGCCRISLCETLTIPFRSCRVVEMDVDIGKVAVKLDQGQADCLVECLPIAKSTGITMGSQLVKLDQNKVLVNLINVHDEPKVLNKGKTLGSVQPVGSVSLVSHDATSHSTPSQSSPLLTLDDVPDFTRAMLEGAKLSAEKVSDCCE